MSGEESSGIDESKFTGWRKYYNSYTDKGRLGASVITLSFIGLGIAYLVFKPKKRIEKQQK